MEKQLQRTGIPAPGVIGIDEVSLRKGHTYQNSGKRFGEEASPKLPFVTTYWRYVNSLGINDTVD